MPTCDALATVGSLLTSELPSLLQFPSQCCHLVATVGNIVNNISQLTDDANFRLVVVAFSSQNRIYRAHSMCAI